MKKPRVVLAEDHAIVAEGLRTILAQEVDLLRTVGDGRALVEAVAELDPDMVITDLTMPDLNGIDATRRILRDHPRVKVIVLTMHTDVKFAEAAFRAGVHGYVVKRSDSTELITAIHEVQRGNTYLTPVVTKDVLQFFVERVRPSTRAENLTERQREVLQLIAEGATIKGIAQALGISAKTAETHRYAIMKELDLHTTAELTRYAIQQGIVSLA
jgi:DNA-binding NarL/FixJ family response regulator